MVMILVLSSINAYTVLADDLPDHYQDVIQYFSENYYQVLGQEDGLDTTYISGPFTQRGPIDALYYALYDVDNNGVPELFIGDQGSAAAVYTYADGGIYLLADYNETGYITNRGNIDILEDGTVVTSLSGGVAITNFKVLDFNEDGTAWVPVAEYEFNQMNNPREAPYENLETGELLTEEEFREEAYNNSPKIEQSSWHWTPIEPGGGQVEDVDENDEPEDQDDQVDQEEQEEPAEENQTERTAAAPVSDIDASEYLGQLRQANDRWANRLQGFNMLSGDEVASADRNTDGRHPVIGALYDAFDSALATFQGGSASDARALYSHTFAIEKMMLPEFNEEDLNALDTLREWLVSIIEENYLQRSGEGMVTSQYAYDDLQFDGYLQTVEQFNDAQFDAANRIAIDTGVAAEAYGLMLDDASGDYKATYRTNPHSQDISSASVYSYDSGSNSVIESDLVTSSSHEVLPIDYSSFYGVEITNHYSGSPAASQGAAPQASQAAPVAESSAWSQNQAQSLAQGISSWGRVMGQQYEEYTPDHQVDFYGVKAPEQEMEINLDGQVQTARYLSEDTKDGLIILAAYSDIKDTQNPSDERHLYFFVSDNGTPRILITMAGADDKGHLSFHDTQNADLDGLFKGLF